MAKNAAAAVTSVAPVVKLERKAMGNAKSDSISIPALQTGKIAMKIVGKTSLITHAWSEKATREMRDKQQGAAKMKKAPKDPKVDFEGAKYKDSKGRDCVQASFFKNAIVSACRYAEDMKMTVLRGALFVEGTLLPIQCSKCVMREDHVRVGMGTADLRYRPEYQDWSVDVVIEYNRNMLTVAQVINLVKLAGFSVGICEWRPEKNGDFGRFDVDPKSIRELKVA